MPTPLSRSSRRGTTVMEVLVVITVIAILLAIILPAVQFSRATSRRVDCANRMRQIGVALAAFESTHQEIPPARRNHLSWITFLLPWLGEAAVHAKIDFSKNHQSMDDENALSATKIPALICPESPRGTGTSYLGNIGTPYLSMPPAAFIERRVENGFFTYGMNKLENGDYRSLRIDEIEDGLSTTVAVSETHRSSTPTAMRTVVAGKDRGLAVRLETAATHARHYSEFVQACDALNTTARVGYHLGGPWHDGEVFASLYTHHLPPNSNSCMFTSPKGEMRPGRSIASANSVHGSGVNVLFADSSGRFMSDSIDPVVWQSLGTRDGREVLSDSW